MSDDARPVIGDEIADADVTPPYDTWTMTITTQKSHIQIRHDFLLVAVIVFDVVILHRETIIVEEPLTNH